MAYVCSDCTHYSWYVMSSCLFRLISDSPLCQHARKDGSCCSGGSSNINSGSGVASKPNSASKESKELKSKKQNWGIKLNCTKLKGIKSLSSSLSSERKLYTIYL